MQQSAFACSKKIIITNELGLHARSAAKIAKLAKQARAKVWIIKEQEKADASSTIDILTLACAKGTPITVAIDDPSDLDIFNAIAKLVEAGFGE